MSYAMHCFNLQNQLRKFYYEGKRLPSLRMHITNMAPSGFMKSYYGENMGTGDYAIFKNTGIHIDQRQEMSTAGLIGTKHFADGVTVTTEGVAEKMKESILVVDEFSGVIQSSKISYNSAMESQLLALLDSGLIYKTLGSGEIAYNSQLTLWSGIQPGKMDLMGGIARRTVFLLFMPTMSDSRHLVNAQYAAQNMPPDEGNMASIWTRVDEWHDKLKCVESLSFDESVREMYDKLGVYCFEVTLFNRMALAYHLSTHEPTPDIVVNVDDNNFIELAKKAKEWRDNIIQGVPSLQLAKMIKNSGKYDDEKDTFTIKKNVLIKDAVMLTWNSGQVNDLLIEMMKNGQVKVNGNEITLLSER